MRCLLKNKQTIYYALLLDTVPIYKLDSEGNKIVDYVDEETGTTYYVETGVKMPLYSPAVKFKGNIAFAGADLLRQEFGISDERYEAVLVLNKDQIPITETSLIWYETEPTTKTYDEKEYADESTADYRVLRSVPSINNDRYILAKVVK
jgi:hypothetical protein